MVEGSGGVSVVGCTGYNSTGYTATYALCNSSRVYWLRRTTDYSSGGIVCLKYSTSAQNCAGDGIQYGL